MDFLSMDFFKSEIQRGFRVLGATQGYMQNTDDIRDWYREGYITEEQKKELRQYNMDVFEKEGK